MTLNASAHTLGDFLPTFGLWQILDFVYVLHIHGGESAVHANIKYTG